MPTYEYACKACGHQFEEIQKMSEPAIDVCPKCGEKAAQRLISQGNFILKGGGWYTTGGYGSPAKKADDASSTSSSGKPAGTDKAEPKKPEGVPDALLPPALKSSEKSGSGSGTGSGSGSSSGGDGGSSTSRLGSGRESSSSSPAA